ncbi:conserved exported hypothetical protein [Aeromicrobium sp. 9AM]|nr:conserved exported hypothetical protein [Aeromicrobium sp. 9AM]
MTSWWRARSIRQMVLMAGAVLLLVSGLFGGLRDAPAEAAVPLVVGKPHEAAPFTLTVERARWTSDLGEIAKTDRGRYLIVIVKVRTDADRSVDLSTLQEALALRGAKGIYAAMGGDKIVPSLEVTPSVYVLADGTPMSALPPGLTYELVYIWEQRGSEPVPERLKLASRSHTWRQSSLDEQMNWFDPTVDAVGTVPLIEAKP